jgi:adenosylcobinamide-phosphate synthase
VISTPIEIAAGAALDFAIGDPRWLPHPIRGFGWLSGHLETVWRAAGLPLKLAGVLFWISAVAMAGGFVAFTLWALPRPYSHVYWIFSLLAIRDLDVRSNAVIRAVSAKHIGKARELLARIVGRDTQSLGEPEIVRASIETVAENLSDAVVAPLLYLACAGPVGMGIYKAINTLDSMVGYRNERYRDFGWFAARADDAVNYLPARLTAALIAIAALPLGLRYRAAIRAAWRDGRSQPSPNSGYPEAAVAGAIGVQLGGLNYYGGVPSLKPHLGDALLPLTPALFPKVRLLLYATAALAVTGACLL